jgi:hypothetical protein
MKHRLMALLAFYLCLFESAHAQWQWTNSSHPIFSNTDGRKFAITFAAILVGVFVVLSVVACLTQRRRVKELPGKNQHHTRQPSGKKQTEAEEKERACRKCGAKLTKAPAGDWFCLNC